MPEGPETHRDALTLAGLLARRTLCDAWIYRPELAATLQGLVGTPVGNVRAWGKTMLVEFAGQTLYSHNQLYGKWFFTAPGVRPDTRRDLRLALHGTAGSAWLYSASTIGFFPTGAHDEVALLRRLGPDVLWPSTDATVVRARLGDPRFRRRRLGALLLDQQWLAGLGNYLRSEILFRAGLDADLTVAALDRPGRERLIRHTLELPRRSLEDRGVLLTRSARRHARKLLGGPRRFWVFAREDEPCLVCGALIRRREHSGRRLYDCPVCQPTAT